MAYEVFTCLAGEKEWNVKLEVIGGGRGRTMTDPGRYTLSNLLVVFSRG